MKWCKKYTTGQSDILAEAKQYKLVSTDTFTRTIYLGLGSNLGNRLDTLEKACLSLERIGDLSAKSGIYESPAWGYADDRPYLNMVCVVESFLSSEELHRATLQIEVALGRENSKRKRNEPFRPRTIDIDILFVGDECINTDLLVIPHPHICLRNFVLRPMVDVAPDFVHPVYGKSMRGLLAESEDTTQLQKVD